METVSIAQQIYQTNIRDLPIIERLKLVQLVLSDLLDAPAIQAMDESWVWNEENYTDLTRASLIYAS